MSVFYNSMEEVREANLAAGDFWFSEETLAFFSSLVEEEIVAGQFFVTSERCTWGDGRGQPHPRRWTVRRANEDGSISTVGEWRGHGSREEAWAWLDSARCSGEVRSS